MQTRESTSKRGILRPDAVGTRFTLARHAPAEALAHVIERYWIVAWDFAPGESYLSETLPHPTVNVVFEDVGSAVHGVPRERFSRTLTGKGSAFGVKFRPGAFAPIWGASMHTLTGKSVPVSRVFGGDIADVDRVIRASSDDAARIEAFETYFAPRAPARDPEVDKVVSVMVLALDDEALTDVGTLAARAGIPVRTLERLFRRYVGVSPKWVLRRFRIQEAAERAVKTRKAEWAGLAADLGYFDQSHFARDFKAQIGTTPSLYAARCAL